ncbi:hypothetical protein SDC9_21722 [bioreactor metagenome]|uniref:PrgI family protein n=1 Tax=bioreactor metagenome TaxID=1076179 RepID=A0A644UAI8_9ZZZZ|nr:PrgI family protein [Candidatus Elulimicrobiales bacterium]
MQFRLPQFLDIEDKIFGPFTLKQFGYLLGAIAFGYLFWRIIPAKIIAVPLILIFSGTFVALAFVKINNRPFADILESAYKFLIGNKTYVWYQEKKIEKEEPKKDLRAIDLLKKNKIEEEKSPFDKIRELSGKLDILDEDKKHAVNLREELIKRNQTKNS